MLHQHTFFTSYNRYPDIFNQCSSMMNNINNKNVLSFGCSIGDEIQTLKDLYFKESIIDGVDINSDCVSKCTERFSGSNKIFDYNEFVNSTKKYDVIFAMSVFCKWEDTEYINDCSSVYSFKMFDDGVKLLYNKLNAGGVLCVYNSNFCMNQSSIYNLFVPITTNKIKDSGFVHKFNNDNKKIENNYCDVIFKKK